MTPEERAIKLHRNFSCTTGLESTIKTFKEAVELEREACAKIAAEFKPWCPVGLEIAQAIRARGSEGK